MGSDQFGRGNIWAGIKGIANARGVPLGVSRTTYDVSSGAHSGAIAAHKPGGVLIPDNSIICGGFVDVVTTFTSATDAATIALSVQSANDIVSAVAISAATDWDVGRRAIVPKANTPETTSIKLTANRIVTVTVAVEVVTAGKFELFLYFLPSS
jgi:hypothetical protein